MGKFFIGGETFKVAFPDGELVDIKQEFTQADVDFITTRMMQPQIGQDSDAKIGMVFGKQATLERAIVAWSFREDDKPVPVTPENISNLKVKYRTLILTEIDRLSQEANSFSKNSQTASI